MSAGVSPVYEFDIPCVPCAAGVCNKLKWLLAWPLCLLLYFTVPNCSSPRWENWFMLSFVSSTLWIAAFSYVMVWMVSGGGVCPCVCVCVCDPISSFL